jgi:carbohydrate kinase (thermoresistant glucokinase family)
VGGVVTQSVWHVVFMGVSGSGKSTVAEAVNDRLGWEFAEGDDFHPQANVEKMSAGRPLTDEDRIPWLEALAAWARERDRTGTPTLMSCSALRRSYRDILRRGGEQTFFVHLAGDKGLLLERMNSREQHFMPPNLLESQLDTLEPLGDEESGMVLDVADPPDRLAEQVLQRLDLR